MTPLIQTLITILRNPETSRKDFRLAADTLSHCLANQASQHLLTKKFEVKTPLNGATGYAFEQEIMLVPILRSGIVMLQPFLHYFPYASIGVVGLKRDEKTAQAHYYYDNIPPITKNHMVMILDPMIATGGSGSSAIDLLKKHGCAEEQILFVGVIAAPEGIAKLKKEHPGITLIVGVQDAALNPQKFIIPGLGDFGDRYFGTEN